MTLRWMGHTDWDLIAESWKSSSENPTHQEVLAIKSSGIDNKFTLAQSTNMAQLDTLQQGSSVLDECSNSFTSTRTGRLSLVQSYVDRMAYPIRPVEDRAAKYPRSSTGPKSTTTKRRVSFYDMVAVRVGLHRNDYTEEEFSASWYSEQECNTTHLEAKMLVGKMNKGDDLSREERLSTRGLECRTRNDMRKRAEIRALSRALVYEQQNWQCDKGVRGPESLAISYFAISNQTQIEAIQRALLDEIAAQMA